MFKLLNPDTMFKPTAGYSQLVEVTDGKIVYIAGQVALDKAGTLVGGDDFRAQLQQVFENLKAAVEAAGGTFANLVKLNWYCGKASIPRRSRWRGRSAIDMSIPRILPPARSSS